MEYVNHMVMQPQFLQSIHHPEESINNIHGSGIKHVKKIRITLLTQTKIYLVQHSLSGCYQPDVIELSQARSKAVAFLCYWSPVLMVWIYWPSILQKWAVMMSLEAVSASKIFWGPEHKTQHNTKLKSKHTQMETKKLELYFSF